MSSPHPGAAEAGDPMADESRRRFRLWDLYFGIIGAGTVAFMLAFDAGHPAPLAAVALLVAIGVWYVAFGRRLILAGAVDGWLGALYAAGVAVLFLPTLALDGSAYYALFALAPQMYMVLAILPATAMVSLFAAGMVVPVLVRTGDVARTLAGPTPAALMIVAFSAVFGGWMARVIRRSTERAELIRELEETRAQVAHLSHQAGVDAERRRLAGEIHDTIAQGLSSVLMLVQAADAELDTGPEHARRHLDLAARTARENLAEVRALVTGLTPSALADASLSDALGRQVARFGAETGMRTDWTVTGTAHPMAASAEVVLLRAAQESLANVRKHSGATTVCVRLDYRGDAVVLEVVDNGCGTARGATDSGSGYGLTAMRDRVGQVGGALSVAGRPGLGTAVRVEVPV